MQNNFHLSPLLGKYRVTNKISTPVNKFTRRGIKLVFLFNCQSFIVLCLTLTYGNVSLGLLFDGQIGGRIYSSTHPLMNTGGTIR
jgi:hypothetical protein